MTTTALIEFADADGQVPARLMQRYQGHPTAYSQLIISFLAGAKLGTQETADRRVFDSIGFVAAALVAHLAGENPDSCLINPESEYRPNLKFRIYDRNGDVVVRAEDEYGILYETNVSRIDPITD